MPNKSKKPDIPDFSWAEKMVRKYPEIQWKPGAAAISDMPHGWKYVAEEMLASISAHLVYHPIKGDGSWAVKFKNWLGRRLRKIGLRHLSNHLMSAAYKRHFRPTPPPRVVIGQIKEKFAGLRVYYDGGDDRVAGMIEMAESMCSRTCQNSGAPGTRTTLNGWSVVLSDKVYKSLQHQALSHHD